MKTKKLAENYLERIPVRKANLRWTTDEAGLVTLEVDNKGAFNRVAQVLFKKPKVSFVHLDEFGSFVWQQIDGQRDITALGELVDAHFHEKVHPLYERLAQYCKILESYGFVQYQ